MDATFPAVSVDFTDCTDRRLVRAISRVLESRACTTYCGGAPRISDWCLAYKAAIASKSGGPSRFNKP